jgi:hypothetical protein
MFTVVAILFGALVTAASATACGWLIWRRVALSRGERWPLAFVTGAAVWSLVIFALCATHTFRRGIVLALSLAVVALAWRARRVESLTPPSLPRWQRWFAFLLFTPFSVLYLTNALAPEWSPDGSTYHLAIPIRYLQARGFTLIADNFYSHLSQGVELLYLQAFAFGRHPAAATLHWLFFVAATLLIFTFARRHGQARAGLAAALFFYASPVIGIDGSSAYIDLAVAAVILALFYTLELWRESPHPPLLTAAGVLAGYTFAAKYTAAVFLLYALGVVAWRARAWRPVLTLGALAALSIVPWLAKNYAYTGNPLAPFFNTWFPNPFVHVQFEVEYQQWFRRYDLTDLRLIPWEVTVPGFQLGGALGPLFLLTPVGLLALRRPAGRAVALAFVVALVPYPLNIGTRFLIPAVPFASLLIALAVDALERRGLVLALALTHAVLCWPKTPPGLLTYWSPQSWRLTHVPYRAALRQEPEDGYLRRKSQGYEIVKMFERHVPPGERILAVNGLPDAYLSRPFSVTFQSAEGERLQDIWFAGFDPARQPMRVLRYSFAPAARQRLRVVLQQRGTPGMQWSINELRVYAKGTELARRPEWRLTANPERWDSPRAFDNSPVTRWRSWRTAEPGMFLQVDLGTPQTVDRVDVETSPDSPLDEVALESFENGAWRVVEARPTVVEVPLPKWLRRTASAELLRQGIRYLAIRNGEYSANDLREAPEEWGIRAVDELHGLRLYRIEDLKPVAAQP